MNASEIDASGIVPHYFALHAALLQDSGDCIGSEKVRAIAATQQGYPADVSPIGGLAS